MMLGRGEWGVCGKVVESPFHSHQDSSLALIPKKVIGVMWDTNANVEGYKITEEATTSKMVEKMSFVCVCLFPAPRDHC